MYKSFVVSTYILSAVFLNINPIFDARLSVFLSASRNRTQVN